MKANSLVVLALTAAFSTRAAAKVVCVKDSSKGVPIRVRETCKPGETQLGSFDALLALLAGSSSPDGGATLRLTGSIQFANPLQTASSALRPAVLPPPPRTS
jgi:hypothetical protein